MYKFLSLFIALGVAVQPVLAEVPRATRPVSIYYSIAPELLPHEIDDADEEGEFFPANGEAEHLTDSQKRHIVFGLFGRHSKTNLFVAPYHQFDTHEIRKDLEVFTHTDANLFRKMCKTKTIFGEAVFAKMLAQPTSDKNELLRRQSIVKALIALPELFALVEHCLEKVKSVEPLFLSFFSSKNELRQRLIEDLYFNKGMWGAVEVNTAPFDRSPNMLLASEVGTKVMTLFSLLFLKWRWEMAEREAGKPFLYSIMGLYLLTVLKPKWGKKISPAVLLAALGGGIWRARDSWKKAGGRDAMRIKHEIEYAADFAQDERARNNILGQIKPLEEAFKNAEVANNERFKKLSFPQKSWEFLNTSFRSLYDKWTMIELVVNTPMQVFENFHGIKGWYKKYQYLQAKFQRLQQAVILLRQVNATFLERPDVLRQLVELYPMLRVLEKEDGILRDTKQLFELLRKDTFKGKFTLMSHLGNISAANTLMLGSRRDWVAVFESIGHLDTYLSIARLMRDSAGSRAPYCFATYEDRSTPHMALTDFWNPFVDPEKVVTNSLELGKTDRNMILTGPNTGGKSTVLKALAINVLMAQTFGIAAARSFELVPFGTIITNIRIEDNIEKGVSLFMAETKRAKLLKDTIAALKPDQFGLVIIDEMFRGTAPDQAALLAHLYAKDELGSLPNCMLLEATHYPEMIKIESETNGLFSNYRVAIERNPDGTLRRTYQLQRGSTTQNVAADILREQGFAIKPGA